MTVRTSCLLSRAARHALLGLAVIAPLGGLTSLAFAQPAAQQDAEPAIPRELLTSVENYWHYGKIGRYELQAAAAQNLLAAGADPQVVLRAFEQVVAEREQQGDSLEAWMIRWQTLDASKESANQVNDLLMQGRLARRAEPSYIKRNIQRLGTNEVGYRLGIEQLRNSGELAVPMLLDTLRDPAQASLHAPVGRALRDLGKLGLNPLLAATQMQDFNLLPTVLLVLGDLGYDAAAPALAEIAARTDIPQPVRDAANRALQQLNVQPGADAGKLYYDLAEKLYYDRSAITADPRYPVAYVWSWRPSGLDLTEVPPQIFNDIMAMRAARSALALGAEQDAAQSLWLAANYRRELNLPEGTTDNTQPENAPSAHFYGVASGAKYLNTALARSLRDRNSKLALAVIRSLQEIGGESNLGLDRSNAPLITALQYPDRRVRFESAFALAGALPQQAFQGQEAVVPMLTEAIAQTGQPTVLLVMPSEERLNQIAEPLKAAGFVVSGATSAATALSAASSLPAVDVIVVSDDVAGAEVEQLFSLAAGTPKLAGSSRLVMTRTAASPWEQRKLSDPLLSTAVVADGSALVDPIKQAREQGGALPLDADLATEYATRAGELLQKVAISRGQVYDLSVARNPLLASLDDERPEIVKLAGGVLGLIEDPRAQAGLLGKAAADGVSDEIKVSLLKSLATNARFFGNGLDAEQVTVLEGLVAGDASLEVKSAAAEARGALNLPAEQSKQLILNSPAK